MGAHQHLSEFLASLDAFAARCVEEEHVEALCDLAATTAVEAPGVIGAAVWLAQPSSESGFVAASAGTGVHEVAFDGNGWVQSVSPSRLHGVAPRSGGNDPLWWLGVVLDHDGPPASDLLVALRILAHQLAARTAVLRSSAERRVAELKYRTLVEQIPAVTYTRDVNSTTVTFISPQIRDLVGFEPEEVVERPNFWKDRLHPDDREAIIAHRATVSPSDRLLDLAVTYRMVHRDGHDVWVLNHAVTVRDAAGAPAFVIGVLFDVTETRQLEDQYRQAHKMEAVGRLAGGIAHDFNNILTGVIGFADLIIAALDKDDPNQSYLEEIIAASTRAGRLVAQLLSFSRQSPAKAELVHIATVLDQLRPMFDRVVRADIGATYAWDAEVGATMMDPNDIERIVVNLLVNACDAMPDGGRLLLQARNATVDEAFVAARGEGEPGDYVLLSVSDSGVGMDAATRERMFEPFYTTKPVGKGTGLGLATIHGIVRGVDGWLGVTSEPGAGTTVEVYLPRVDPSKVLEQSSNEGNGATAIREQPFSTSELVGKARFVSDADTAETP